MEAGVEGWGGGGGESIPVEIAKCSRDPTVQLIRGLNT
jgi:hypothetical protein